MLGFSCQRSFDCSLPPLFPLRAREVIRKHWSAVELPAPWQGHERPSIVCRSAGRRSKTSGPSTDVPHASVEEFLSSLSPGDFFGDDHRVHLPSSTRLVFQNVNGLPLTGFIDWTETKTIGYDRLPRKVTIRLLHTTRTVLAQLHRALSMADALLLF